MSERLLRKCILENDVELDLDNRRTEEPSDTGTLIIKVQFGAILRKNKLDAVEWVGGSGRLNVRCHFGVVVSWRNDRVITRLGQSVDDQLLLELQ